MFFIENCEIQVYDVLLLFTGTHAWALKQSTMKRKCTACK